VLTLVTSTSLGCLGSAELYALLQQNEQSRLQSRAQKSFGHCTSKTAYVNAETGIFLNLRMAKSTDFNVNADTDTVKKKSLLS
jgi:hypothetical protein